MEELNTQFVRYYNFAQFSRLSSGHLQEDIKVNNISCREETNKAERSTGQRRNREESGAEIRQHNVTVIFVPNCYMFSEGT